MKLFKQMLVFAFGGASLSSSSALEPQSLKSKDKVENQLPSTVNSDILNTRRRSIKKGKKTAAPTPSPSVSPTETSVPSSIPTAASNKPSSAPSSEPSSQPSVCKDEEGWEVGGSSIYIGFHCDDILSDTENWCSVIQSIPDATFAGKSVSEACCDCGGGSHQTIFPSTTPTSPPTTSHVPTQQHFPSETPTAAPTECEDEPNWIFATEGGATLGCEALKTNPAKLCLAVEPVNYLDKTASLACCICGGGVHLTVPPSVSPTSEPTSKPSSQPSLSSAPSDKPSLVPSQFPSDAPSTSPSSLPTISVQPSIVPSMTFAAAFDGDSCNYDTECRERPKYSQAKQAVQACAGAQGYAPGSRTKGRVNGKGKGKKKTRSPTSQPSTIPSIFPSTFPSTFPSNIPTSAPSTFPSLTPSTAPSSFPSLEPSSSPSEVPSSSPSEFPSLEPSSMPSVSPSDFPSLTPSVLPSEDPTTVPTISLMPSGRPQHFSECVSNQCVAQSLNLKIEIESVDINEKNKGNKKKKLKVKKKKKKIITAIELTTAVFEGSYGNAVGDRSDGSHDQDFNGGVVVHSEPDDGTISMFGNAWKAYRLSKSFAPTKSSYIEFYFTVVTEAEGHAICLDEDVNEDTFGGSRRRCIMLAGTQVDRWDNVKKYNIAGTEEAISRQSSNDIFLNADAEKAVDGIIDPYWNEADDNRFNSISKTQDEVNPWWEVVLGGDYEIHDVIIYNRLDDSYIDVLSNFTVWIIDDNEESDPNKNNTKVQYDVSVVEAFDRYHIRVDPATIGRRVRITLNKKGSLQLAEVVVMGRDATSCGTQKYSIPIGDLFAGSEENVNYISFIQDNDADASLGESEFSDIVLKTEVPPSIVKSVWKLNENRKFEISTKNLQNNNHPGLPYAKIDLSEELGTAWNVQAIGKDFHVYYNECVADLLDFLEDRQVSPVNRSSQNSEYYNECQRDSKCGRCQGDCDEDDDCKSGLTCHKRDRNDPVDDGEGGRCIGSDSTGYDYCVAPTGEDWEDKRVPCQSEGAKEKSAQGDVTAWEDLTPDSISVASNGRIVVGYKDYIKLYKAPSDRPSSIPSSSPSENPSQSHSENPSQSPSKSPSQSPIDPPVTRRRSQDTPIDKINYGAVLIIDPVKVQLGLGMTGYPELDDFKTVDDPLEWVKKAHYDFLNDNLLGDSDVDMGFGSTVVISADSSTIAITSTGTSDAYPGGRVEVYKFMEDDDDHEYWTQKGRKALVPESSYELFGKITALSEDGDKLAVSARSDVEVESVFVFGWNSDKNDWIGVEKLDLVKDFNITALSISLDTTSMNLDVLGADSTVESYKIIGICEDFNAEPKGSENDIENLQCICREGFLSSGGKGNFLEEDSDYCVACAAANNVVVSASTISFTFDRFENRVSAEVADAMLLRHEPDEDVSVTLTSKKFSSIDVGTDKEEFSFSKLRPGYRYTTSLTQTYEEEELQLQCPIVTSCSCDHSTFDRTGRPKDFSVYQMNGHIMFTFRDNSYCEEAFSFTRVDVVDEFMLDATQFASSVTSDFYFSAADKCNTTITPETQASDDLELSNLIVGKEYAYCVRAINNKHYMDSPYDGAQFGKSLTSSGATCASHRIRWEASFHGIVTTEPDAGRIPIEHVTVSWELLDETFIALECDGCAGTTQTTDGGAFTISFNVLDDALKDRNDDEIPVRIFFAKTSGDIQHEFLCKDGVVPCDDTKGFIAYLSHLQFKEPLHIYDDTSVPFEGKVFIADTDHGSNDGCPIVDAEVCLIHNNTQGIEETLVCVDTDGDGGYVAPVIVGGTVHRVDVRYSSHDFKPAKSNDAAYLHGEGLTITADDFYLRNDFKDVSKTNLKVEVVGGECEKQLGESTVLIRIVGCEWGNEDKYPEQDMTGNEFIQSGKYNTYQNLPAHFLRVEITDIQEIIGSKKERITKIFNAFQVPPLIREIDLLGATQKSESLGGELDTIEAGNGDTGIEDNYSANATAADDEEDSTVRFQYDGELIMTVAIDKNEDKLDCTTYDTKFKDGESFHVIDYMTIFKVDVALEYEIIADRIYCDIVDDGLEVLIDSQVGVDDIYSESWKIFYDSIKSQETKDALTHCSPVEGACRRPIIHDRDDSGEKTGRARIETYTLATGRPNIIEPFTKRVTFSTIGGTASLSHQALFFIEGFYSQGPGNSFALPTHEPIMVLRDPPGGSSQAHYENVQTTVRVVTSETESTSSTHFDSKLVGVISNEAEACVGGGFGVIVILCKEVTMTEFKIGLHKEFSITDYEKKEDQQKSNEFQTTWSYSTSDDPGRAGYMSDVFVVPNLNVLYETVYVVSWNNAACSPVRIGNDDDKDWPSKVVFDVDAESSQNSLAFYSRFQIKDQKIPELETASDNIQFQLNKIIAKENVCCCLKKCNSEVVSHDAPCSDEETFVYNYGNCPLDDEGSPQENCGCSAKDEDIMREKLVVTLKGLRGWNTTFEIDKEEFDKKNNIIDWFTSVGKKDMYDESDLSLDDQVSDQSSAILPPSLAEKAVTLDNGLFKRRNRALSAIKENRYHTSSGEIAQEANILELIESNELRRKLNANEKLKRTKRIQFDGGAGMFEMTMTKEKTEEWHTLSCWLGCSEESDDITGPASELETEIFGFGVEAEINIDFEVHVEHVSQMGGENTEATTVGFSLGDPDIGDEFVVEVFFDERYGTMMFETIAGRSACPHEAKTLPNEKPLVKVLERSSPFVFPDDPMVFEVELRNEGVGAFADFILYPVQGNGIGGVSVAIDGVALTEDGTSVFMLGDTSMTKQVVITRGPNVYQDAPIDITFQSKCENLYDMNDVDKLSIVKLSNTLDDDQKEVIEWVKPCPTVEWASELKRDQGFLVNLNSDYEDKLSVTVLNPLATAIKGDNSFLDLKTVDRLEFVYLRYRKVGRTTWEYAKTSVSSMSPPVQNLDFAISKKEDSYGYSTLDWNIESSLVKPGDYEIMVETRCTNLGGPEEINGHQTSILPGIIDLSRPEKYGEPLPLKETIIAGEEVVVVFTEDLDCSEPLPFEIAVRIRDTVDLTEDNLHIRCEGRKIGFQIKLVSVQYEDLLGKEFQVEIGKIRNNSANVFDLNGNGMEYNVVFNRSFAEIDLSAASTSFRLLLENFSIPEDNITDDISTCIAEEIVSAADVSNRERLTFSDISYDHTSQRASARVHISPPSSKDSNGFRMLHGNVTIKNHAVKLFYGIQSVAEENNSRKLATIAGGDQILVSISDLKIMPSDEDAEKFKTRPERAMEENILYQISSTDSPLDTPNETADLIVRTIKEEREETRKEREETRKELVETRHEMENMEEKLNQILQQTGDRGGDNVGAISSSQYAGDPSVEQDLHAKRMEKEPDQQAKYINESLRSDMDKMFFYSCVLMVTSAAISIAAFFSLRK